MFVSITLWDYTVREALDIAHQNKITLTKMWQIKHSSLVSAISVSKSIGTYIKNKKTISPLMGINVEKILFYLKSYFGKKPECLSQASKACQIFGSNSRIALLLHKLYPSLLTHTFSHIYSTSLKIYLSLLQIGDKEENFVWIDTRSCHFQLHHPVLKLDCCWCKR